MASVHFKVLMFVLGKNAFIDFISAFASVLQVDMYPLSKAEVSREYREEKRNVNKSVAEKKASI